MFDSPHDRAFGVEIECGFPGGTSAARSLIDSLHGPGARARADSEYGSTWSVGADGTEVEIRTPILQGEEGFDILKRTMRAIRNAGGYTTPSDGMHVHHDAPDFAENPRLCVPLVESWRRNRESVQSLVAPRRRNSYSACPEWSDSAFEVLTNWVECRGNLYLGRNDLNLANLGERRTRPSIEIRLHEGTLDGDVAASWVQFGQKFLFDVVKLNGRRLRKRDTDESLLDRIKLSPEATAILLAKKNYDFATPLSMFQSIRRYDDYDSDYDDEDYCCDCCAGTCGPDCCGDGEDY